MAALIYSIKAEKSVCSRLHLRIEVRAAGSIICYRGFQTAILVATVPRSFNQLLDNGALSRQRSNGLCESEPLVGSCDSMNIPSAIARKKGRNPGFRPCGSRNGCGGQIWTDDLRVMRSDSAFAESRTVPSSRGTGCSPSSLYAFLALPRLGSVLPCPHSGP